MPPKRKVHRKGTIRCFVLLLHVIWLDEKFCFPRADSPSSTSCTQQDPLNKSSFWIGLGSPDSDVYSSALVGASLTSQGPGTQDPETISVTLLSGGRDQHLSTRLPHSVSWVQLPAVMNYLRDFLSANFLISLAFSFLFCKMGMAVSSRNGVVD